MLGWLGRETGNSSAIAGQLKLKLPRDEFVFAIESIIRDLNIAEREALSIEKTFTYLGQNFYKPEKTVVAFKKRLDEMEAGSAYGGTANCLQRLLEDHQQHARIDDTDTMNE